DQILQLHRDDGVVVDLEIAGRLEGLLGELVLVPRRGLARKRDRSLRELVQRRAPEVGRVHESHPPIAQDTETESRDRRPGPELALALAVTRLGERDEPEVGLGLRRAGALGGLADALERVLDLLRTRHG